MFERMTPIFKFAKSRAHLLMLSALLICSNALAEPILPTDAELHHKETLSRLESIHSALEKALVEQKNLSKSIKRSSEDEKPALIEEKSRLDSEVETLNRSYEQIALGGIDTSSFLTTTPAFNWQTEIIQIVQPVIENLKVITEKPRKIERLRGKIRQLEEQNLSIDEALISLESLNAANSVDNTSKKLNALTESWSKRRQDNVTSIELTQFQLMSLQGDNASWTDTIKKSFDEFAIGRGLTLLMAFAAACAVWLFTRSLLWLMRRGSSSANERRSKTRYRLAAYAYSLLSSTLIVISIMVVFYTRGDVLLLGVSILLVAGAAIGLRNTLPKFVAETKLLLNIGALREGERVMYQGIPWKVRSLNLYSILYNPEIEGLVRLPLSELTSMTSRGAGTERWFPYSKNDYVLMPNGKLAQLLRLTPEIVELKYSGGASGTIATAELYLLDAINLTRNGSFGVSTTFGIDYQHQLIALDDVAVNFKAVILSSLKEMGLAADVNSIVVELKTAGASSLDYLIFISMDSRVAASYFKIERIIQQACIKACTEQRWGIPFPQLTVHNTAASQSNTMQQVG